MVNLTRKHSPSWRRIVLFLLASGLLLILPAGCTYYRYSAGRMENNPTLRATCLANLDNTYPDTFNLVQRIVLVAKEGQYDFIGYLVVRRPDAFRAMGMGEMGGKLFDFLGNGTDFRIIQKPRRMPPKLLLDGAMGDIRHLYNPAMGISAYLTRSQEGSPALVEEAQNRVVREYTFHPTDLLPVASLEAHKDQVVRRAVYSDYRCFPNWDRPLPARIVVDNFRWRYRLEIDLLEFDPTPDTTRMLEGR